MTSGALSVVDVRTADRAVATRVMGASFPGIEFGAVDGGAPFLFTHRRVADDFFAVNRVSVHGSAQSRGEFPPVIAAGRVLHGRYSLAYGQQSVDTTGPFLRPAGQQLTRFEDASVELITVDTAEFMHRAERQLAGTGRLLRPVTTDVASPISAEAAMLWHSTASHIFTVVEDLEVFGSALVRSTLIDLYVSTLLRAFPISRDVAISSSDAADPRALRRALRFMEEHLAEPLTVAEIADVARLSVRGLHHAFATRLGTTPMRHLRRLRLRAAHDDLVAADPTDGGSVAEIARRWGFTHLSRFADQYREAFDELPSRTFRG